jgi:sirohydrochlorin ferrochelatase
METSHLNHATVMNKTGFIVFAHGSSIESANEAVRAVAQKMAAQKMAAQEVAGNEYDHPNVEAAFLEGGRPDLNSAVATLAQRGVQHVIVVPYFLTLGLHLQRDLPRLAAAARASHPGLIIEITAPLDGHPALVEALLDRAREAAT